MSLGIISVACPDSSIRVVPFDVDFFSCIVFRTPLKWKIELEAIRVLLYIYIHVVRVCE